VAIDPRKLRPSELVRLLNSTPLGEVISERQLHRHRSRAGFRIGDGRTIDLLRYVAWLVAQRHRPRPQAEGLTGYEAHKERTRQRNQAMSLSGRDIGELPEVVDPRRKRQAECDCSPHPAGDSFTRSIMHECGGKTSAKWRFEGTRRHGFRPQLKNGIHDAAPSQSATCRLSASSSIQPISSAKHPNCRWNSVMLSGTLPTRP